MPIQCAAHFTIKSIKGMYIHLHLQSVDGTTTMKTMAPSRATNQTGSAHYTIHPQQLHNPLLRRYRKARHATKAFSQKNTEPCQWHRLRYQIPSKDHWNGGKTKNDKWNACHENTIWAYCEFGFRWRIGPI